MLIYPYSRPEDCLMPACAGSRPASADHWLQWEASVLRPASYQGSAGPVTQQLTVLDKALTAAGPFLTGSKISIADVSV